MILFLLKAGGGKTRARTTRVGLVVRASCSCACAGTASSPAKNARQNCDRTVAGLAGIALLIGYRRTRSVLKAEPPVHLPGTAPCRDWCRPALHAGDARGQVFGHGRKATGARAQSLPIKNIVVGLPHPAVREAIANQTRIDHTRAALNPWRVVRSKAPAPRDACVTWGSCARTVRRTCPADPTASVAGRKTQPNFWKVTPADRPKKPGETRPALPRPGPYGRAA